MALKVTVAKPATTKLKVTTNSGMQGSSYNPQPAANATLIQNAKNTIQNTTKKPLQGGNASAVQSAATTAQIQAAAEATRVAAVKAAEQQKAIIRQQVQLKVDSKVASNTAAIKLKVATLPQSKLTLGSIKTPKIRTPEVTEYDKKYAEAYRQALADFDKKRFDGADKKGLSKVWDKLTFGQDTRDRNARAYAEKRAAEIMDKDFKSYESQVNGYNKKLATAQAAINQAAVNFKSQAEFDKYVASTQKALDAEYNALVAAGASFDGRASAYDKSSKRALTSATARTLSWVAKKASDTNPVWKYTLGSGGANIPSVVQSVGRGVNFIGNISNQNRTIYKEGGTKTVRQPGVKEAWQATQNQRSWNLKPWVDKKYSDSEARKRFGDQAKTMANAWTGKGRLKDKKYGTEEYWLKTYWDDYNRSNRFRNSVLDVATDPLNAVGGTIAKSPKFAKQALAGTKTGSFFAKQASKISDSKTFKWLTAEHKTSTEKLQDAIKAANTQRNQLQNQLVPRITELNKKLSKGDQLDITVFDDLGRLSDWEAKILQRADANGKLARRDLLKLTGQKQTRINLELVSAKWVDFSRKMADVDNVGQVSRKQIYKPYTGWVSKKGKSLDDYDFRMRKTRNVVQSSEQFKSSATDRYLKSSIDDSWAIEQTGKQARRAKERQQLLHRYSRGIDDAQKSVDLALAKTRSVRGRAEKVLGTFSPNAIWKKSVLKYRPAWYVNNVLYNTQAAALAGGSRALIEQTKMLRPKYWRKAMDEVPDEVRTNLAKETGSGITPFGRKISKFGSRVENWSRVAAFRGAQSKGLSNKEALARVDKYLFDYSIKNWERPFKAVVPFWSFQKNLAKAGVQMPLDRPLAAIGYNRIDQYQKSQFDRDFDKTLPELKKLGYSDSEIDAMRTEQAKYFRGRLRVGSKYYTTPFNAFSEKQMSQFGINPFLSAARESSDSVDSFGRQIKGSESSLTRRILSKFPQIELGRQAWLKNQVDRGQLKPTERWIGKAGSEGYGLGKEKQGYDPTKPNYVKSMDPRNKFGDNVTAFFGKPRGLGFDKPGFVENKKLRKVTEAYFSTDWKTMEWDQQQKQQTALFKKYGMTSDDFYKGVLAKYDTENTKRIKDLKEDARSKNNSLLEEYGKQPYGTRSKWAADKLRELVDSGYYGENPFLYSFAKGSKYNSDQGWLTPDTIKKADVGAAKRKDFQYAMESGDWSKWAAKYGIKSEKARLVQAALKSGDWSAYTAKYGTTDKQKMYQTASKTGDWTKWRAKYGTTEKAATRDEAVKTGDWSKYTAKYGVTKSAFEYGGKFFKSAESMERYKTGDFWRRYSASDKATRERMLKENPQFDTRRDWTARDWTKWRASQTEIFRASILKYKTGATLVDRYRTSNNASADAFKRSRGSKTKVTFRLS